MISDTFSLSDEFSPEARVLFACARQSFSDDHRRAVLNAAQQPIAWDAVFSVAHRQGLSPLIFHNLQKCQSLADEIPQAVWGQFKNAYYANVVRKDHRARRLTEALAYFWEREIEAMLIKGGALDELVYDESWYTAPQDVDLILRVKRDDIPQRTRDEFEEHFFGHKIEFDFYEHHDVDMNGVLPVDFDRVWADSGQIDFRGQAVRLMAPEDVLMAACINSCRKRYFRLKSLCDIAESVARLPLDWDVFFAKAKAYDCQLIVYAAFLVTDLSLRCDIPADTVERLEVPRSRKATIDKLARRLLRQEAAASGNDGGQLLGREISASLALTYATYRWYQMGRKTAEIYSAWRE